MTIRTWLQQNGFTIHPTNENPDFPTFARYYDALNLALIFNHLTGEFYALRFQSFDDMYAHQKSEKDDSGLHDEMFKPWVKPCERINILPIVNLNTIETAKQLIRAFAAFEQMIHAELYGNVHRVKFGQRVVVSIPDKPKSVGTVVGMDKTCIIVKMEIGTIWLTSDWVSGI